MEAVVLHRVGFLAHSCPKHGQDFKPSAAPLYPNMGQVTPRPALRGPVQSYYLLVPVFCFPVLRYQTTQITGKRDHAPSFLSTLE